MERNFKEYTQTVREGYQVHRKRNNVASVLGVVMIGIATAQEDMRKVIVLDAFAAVTFVTVTIDSIIEGREILRRRNRNE